MNNNYEEFMKLDQNGKIDYLNHIREFPLDNPKGNFNYEIFKSLLDEDMSDLFNDGSGSPSVKLVEIIESDKNVNIADAIFTFISYTDVADLYFERGHEKGSNW